MGDILGQVLGGGAAAASGGMGGLGGLLEQMQRAGYGEQARSWVGTGQNMPISPDVLGQIFGQGGIEEIARQAGVTPQEASDRAVGAASRGREPGHAGRRRCPTSTSSP